MVVVVSVSIIALTILYALPIFVVVIFGISDIPLGLFSLRRLRSVINWVGLIYCYVTIVFFFFPRSKSPNVIIMN